MPGPGFENSTVSVILWQSQRQEASCMSTPSVWWDSGGETPSFQKNEMLKFKFAIDLKLPMAHAEHMQLKAP